MTQHGIIYGLHDQDRVDLIQSMLELQQLDQSQVTIVHRSEFENSWENYTNNINLRYCSDFKTTQVVQTKVLFDPFDLLVRNIKNVPKSSHERILIIDNYQSVARTFDRELNPNLKKAIKAIVNNDWNISLWIATPVLKLNTLFLERSIVDRFHKQLVIQKADMKHNTRSNLYSRLGVNLDTVEQTFKTSAANQLVYDFDNNTLNLFK
jgi:hypothetical protein